jgi:pyrroline-5-carboxylate reductase
MYGFIGIGNMATAIIKGMVSSGFDSDQIVGYDHHKSNSNFLANELGIRVANSQKELIEMSDIIVLAVKPNVLTNIIKTIKNDIENRNILIISIAVGIPLEFYEKKISPTLPIFRVMPNINALFNSSTTGICTNSTSENDYKKVAAMFSTIGSVTKIDESYFGIFGALAGSTPAFIYLYANALKTAAVKAGMNKDLARNIIGETIFGSANTIIKSDEGLWDLIDKVTSPGGTTIEGISTLQKNNFEATVIKGFEAILEKDKKIKEK